MSGRSLIIRPWKTTSSVKVQNHSNQWKCSILTYTEDDGRSGGWLVDLDHGQNLWHLTVASSSIEQSWWGEEDAIDSSEGWHGYEHRDDHSKATVESPGEESSHSIGAEHLWNTERGVESNVGEGVDHGDEDDGDSNSTRKVPDWILQLLDDKVEIVPSVVSKESRVEWESNLGDIRLCFMPGEVLSFTWNINILLMMQWLVMIVIHLFQVEQLQWPWWGREPTV